MIRISVIVLFLVSQVALASFAFAKNNANLSRDQIRSMDILDRPSRPGHFYGNAVRRKHQSHSGSMRSSPANVYRTPASYGPTYGPTYGGSYQTGGTVIYGQ